MRRILCSLLLILGGCAESARLPVEAGIGPNPTLPTPVHTLIPTVRIATAKGWPAGVTPTAASGYEVAAFATGLDHPRSLLVLPNGDVLVAETNAPERPKEGKGIRGWFFKKFQARAGGAVPSADRITLLRGSERSAFLEKLHSPFGMALIGADLYVANTDAVVRFPYGDGDKRIDASPVKIADLPAGQRNHHWTKNLVASGTVLYASVGSNSNVAENGMEEENGRAAIYEIDTTKNRSRVFATGLRNPNGLAIEPTTGRLWTAVNERDELGSDLVPDYMTSVRDGGFYGWPYSYYGAHVDARVKEQRPDLVAQAIVPDYALGAHTASLGIAFAHGGAFVAQHGSWNRKPRSGYKVIFVPFTDGKPSGPPQDVLTGFVDDEGNARGRPVSVVVDRTGALLVADDVGNAVWRVTVR